MSSGVLRPWSWILREAGAGPDHGAWLRFREEPDGELMETVGRTEMPGFVSHRHRDAAGKLVLTYIDELHSQAFAQNLSGHHRTNLWVHATIQVSGTTLMLENGYGGGARSEVRVQTGLLHRLATEEPRLLLLEWKIAGSDTGIPLKALAEGRTAAELLAYLRGEAQRASSGSGPDERD